MKYEHVRELFGALSDLVDALIELLLAIVMVAIRGVQGSGE
jgi:hypothetical protein